MHACLQCSKMLKSLFCRVKTHSGSILHLHVDSDSGFLRGCVHDHGHLSRPISGGRGQHLHDHQLHLHDGKFTHSHASEQVFLLQRRPVLLTWIVCVSRSSLVCWLTWRASWTGCPGWSTSASLATGSRYSASVSTSEWLKDFLR